jgi:hypothetical protein
MLIGQLDNYRLFSLSRQVPLDSQDLIQKCRDGIVRLLNKMIFDRKILDHKLDAHLLS